MPGVMHVVIFEGSQWSTFAPLCLNRPVFMLSTGMSTLLDKQIRYLGATRLTFWVRPELADFCRTRVVPHLKMPVKINEPLDDEPTLLVSGRSVHFRKFEQPGGECAVVDEEKIREAYCKRPGLSMDDALNRTDRWLSLLELPRMEGQSRLAESLSDLISWNEESLIEDALQLLKGVRKPIVAGPFYTVNDEDIWLGTEVNIKPGCVLDASQGPVVIAEGVEVGSNSVIQGPCYIGPHSVIRPLSLVKNATTIGRLCKIGGEIVNTIMLGHSNKSHEGFLGHSYIGKWVNLGAGTTTANLKSTYGLVSVQYAEREVPTGRQFFGSVIGDHVKTGIGTRLMPGSYIGFCSALLGSAIPPRFIPSFSFWNDKGLWPYDLDKAKQVMRAVYARRDLRWTDADDRMVAQVLETAPKVEKLGPSNRSEAVDVDSAHAVTTLSP
jgi:UDP-N-acetylglucosamine diphosphorylase / glucose-1-phosphate thymidylyltransferase / UDP-N-acetylgalactosamine diphosphorylase / glucosamine-1-phosphate N-acetyltransferase / galactosamine-1-phosphate N-acetyltransferase